MGDYGIKVCADCKRAYRQGLDDGWTSAHGREELTLEPLPNAPQEIGYDGTLGPMWRIRGDQLARHEPDEIGRTS